MRIKLLGLILGILIGLIIIFLPLDGLGRSGKFCFALTMMTVVFWAFQVAQSGFISGLYLALLIILRVANPETVFYSWTGTTMYLIIGAYLIAGAVKSSGLGERIAYLFIIRFVKTYRGIIISIFFITLGLSLLIPHPWPRAFLIMSVMAVIIESAGICHQDAIKIGFTVFAASVPVSLIFLTGDSVINPLAVQNSGMTLGWIGWLWVMGVPAVAASIITCLLILFLFKPTEEIIINKERIKEKSANMGSLSPLEIRTIIWLSVAIILWVSDSLHGINIGWVTFLIAMMMSLPGIGGILTPESWKNIPVHVLLFITAAMAIGKVGAVVGMNAWIAQTILPNNIPTNPYILAALIAAVSVVIHMFLGSVIAVMGVAIPALLIFTRPMGLNPLVPSLWVFTAISVHYLFPFQHLNMLVGLGKENGMYSQKETLRLGIPLTAVVFLIVVLVEVPWWKFINLL